MTIVLCSPPLEKNLRICFWMNYAKLHNCFKLEISRGNWLICSCINCDLHPCWSFLVLLLIKNVCVIRQSETGIEIITGLPHLLYFNFWKSFEKTPYVIRNSSNCLVSHSQEEFLVCWQLRFVITALIGSNKRGFVRIFIAHRPF